MRPSRSIDRPIVSRCSGFSLVELVAVLFIIGVVSALYLSGAPARRQRGQLNNCRQNLLFIHQALGTFASDHAGRFPATNATASAGPLSLLVPQHTARSSLFICPGSTDRRLPEAQPFTGRKISYSYAMGLNREAGASQWILSDAQVNTHAKLVGEPLFSADGKPPGHNHGRFGGNLLFADGHAEFSPTNSAFELRLPPGVRLLNP